jgi:hypothetical protein
MKLDGYLFGIPLSRFGRLGPFRSLFAAAAQKKTYAGTARSVAPEFAALARQMT